MKTYFKNVQTLDELRKQYRDLLKKYHPDNGNGSEEATKAINVEYEKLFKILKDNHSQQNTTSSNTETQYSSYDNMKYDFAEDSLLREMLQKVIYFSDITIEIIGNWSHKKLSINDIQNYYGSTEIETNGKRRLKA